MNTENQELILLTGKMLYQLHIHQSSGSATSLKMAYTYKQRAEDMIKNMDEEQPSPNTGKMYINR